MIEFKDLEYRDSAIIYRTTLEQIKKIYDKNSQQAGELAIAAIEVALAGEHSSDDYLVDVILEQAKFLSTKNKESHQKAVDAKKEARAEKLQLKEIADLLEKGWSQTRIAGQLGTSKQNVSKRVDIIRKEYPELLSTCQQKMVDKKLTETTCQPSKPELVDELSTSQPMSTKSTVDEVDNSSTSQPILSTELTCQPDLLDDLSTKSTVVNYNVNENVNVNDNENVNIDPHSQQFFEKYVF